MRKFNKILAFGLACVSIMLCGAVFSGCTQKKEDKLTEITIEEGINKYNEIATKYLKNDFTVTYGEHEDWVFKYDNEKKVGYYEENGWYEWYWQNGEYCYHTLDTLDIYKYNILNWKDLIFEEQLWGNVLNSEYEKNISIVEDGNYYQIEVILHFPEEPEEDSVLKFIFNNESILRLEVSGDVEGGSVIITFNDREVDLNLPENIKTLESSAVEG